MLLPLLLLALLEIALRLAGVGYPTTLFLEKQIGGKTMMVINPKFPWRFFPPEMARKPPPSLFPKTKAPGTRRVFVLGESAAMGDPDPHFGLPRQLQIQLESRFPNEHWEVINAAMVAINSHAVLPIARECARYQPDAFVIYLGNNEVIGPFGSGTVFNEPVSSLGWIRLNLACKNSRLVQWLQQTFRRGSRREWGGMEMFLGRQVTEKDPRLAATQAHFSRNLQDILSAAKKAGAKAILSTVASNLKDCAPFASEGTLPNSLVTDNATQGALLAMTNGNFPLAERIWKEAATTFPRKADLQFQLAQAELALGKAAEASNHFVRARDLDTLRFRADSSLNRLIASQSARASALIDAEAVLNRFASNSVAGREFFYEHVHFNFTGNFQMARVLAEAVASQFGGGSGPWLSEADCRARLAFTPWKEIKIWQEIRARLQEPPFSTQLTQPAERASIDQSLQRLLKPGRSALLEESLAQARRAHADRAEDVIIAIELAQLLREAQRFDESLALWKTVEQSWPHSPQVVFELGNTYYDLGQLAEADSAFARALILDPSFAEAWNARGLAALAQGQSDRAREWFARAILVRPGFIEAEINQAKVLAGSGDRRSALTRLESVLARQPQSVAAHINAGKLLLELQQPVKALDHFEKAVELDPTHPIARYNLGNLLSELGRGEASIVHFREAVRLDPNLVEARYNLGIQLARAGQLPPAIEQFETVLKLNPQHLEARFSLGVALAQSGRKSEARARLLEVLQQQPEHPQARAFLEKHLRSEANSP